MERRRRPPAVKDRVRCTVCGFWLDPKTRPKGPGSGVSLESYSAALIALGAHVDRRVPADATTGCPFCGSRFWDGGRRPTGFPV